MDEGILYFIFPLPLFRPSILSTLIVTVATRPTAPVLYGFFRNTESVRYFELSGPSLRMWISKIVT
jgi:hypothetical protein